MITSVDLDTSGLMERDGWMPGWVDGLRDGWMDGWIHGWMDVHLTMTTGSKQWKANLLCE